MGNLTGACSGCHGFNTSANGQLSLTGIPSTYAHNTNYSMQVCLVDPSKFAAGFRVEANIGTLDGGIDTKTNTDQDRITHTYPKPFGSVGGSACWDITWTTPATGDTPASFVVRGNAVNSNGSPSGDNAGYLETYSGIVLPVVWGSFELKVMENAVQIAWSSLEELNASHYTIQRSSDGISFENVKRLEAKGRAYEYQYNDNDLNSGLYYYRIAQEDIDGSIEYTAIKSAEISSKQIVVYPNPVRDILYIDAKAKIKDIRIYDGLGKMVLKQASSNSIDVSNLESGMYLVVIDGNHLSAQKIYIH